MKPVKIYVSGKYKYVPVPRWKEVLGNVFIVAWVGFIILLSIATWFFMWIFWPIIIPIWFLVVVALIFVESHGEGSR